MTKPENRLDAEYRRLTKRAAQAHADEPAMTIDEEVAAIAARIPNPIIGYWVTYFSGQLSYRCFFPMEELEKASEKFTYEAYVRCSLGLSPLYPIDIFAQKHH